VYQLKAGDAKPVKMAGLDPQKIYRIQRAGMATYASDAARNGASIMQDGLTTLCRKDYDSEVIELTAE